MKKIIERKIIFDKKKVVTGFLVGTYNVKYYIFYSKDDIGTITEEEVKKLDHMYRDHHACFAQFMYNRGIFKSKFGKYPNRILFLVDFKRHKKEDNISAKEIDKWIDLCKTNNLIPTYIGEDFKHNGLFDIEYSEISKERLYVYLSAARYLQDEPYFIRAVLHMVEDLKLGFFTSFAVATKFCACNSGHHLLNFSRDYSMTCDRNLINSPITENFNIKMVSQLVQFLKNKNEKEKTLGSYSGVKSFRLHETLSKIELKRSIEHIKRQHLLDDYLEESIIEGDFKRYLN